MRTDFYSLILLILLTAMGLGVYGCSDITSINQNPNAPTEVATSYMATAAFVESLEWKEGSLNHGLVSQWVGHISQMQYDWDGRYDLEPGTVGGIWDDVYAGPLQDWTEIVRTATELNRPNEAAVGIIMKSWLFQMVTDAWGDVPYSAANSGLQEDITLPAYDPQAQVYSALISQLTDAAAMLDVGSTAFTNVDFVYGGEMENWRRFANSLRLRLAIRLSEVDPEPARQAFTAALAAGVIESADQEPTFMWEATPANENPWCEHCAGPVRLGEDKINVILADTLKSLSDPRLPIYANPNDEGEYVGMTSGLDDGHGIPFASRSNIGDYFVRQQQLPSILLGYDEVLFLRAEAAARGWTAEDPASLYEEAIRANMARYDIAQGDVDAYVAQPEVAYSSGRGLEQIWLQKWISLYTRGIEAFAEYRRTGVPSLEPAPVNVTGDVIPKRLPYPTAEYALNAANVEEAIARQDGATLVHPIWWDVR